MWKSIAVQVVWCCAGICIGALLRQFVLQFEVTPAIPLAQGKSLELRRASGFSKTFGGAGAPTAVTNMKHATLRDLIRGDRFAGKLHLTAWAAEDPQSALRFVQELPAGPIMVSDLERTVIFTWAARDPEAAFIAASQIRDAMRRDTGLSACMQGMLSSPSVDPDGVGAILSQVSHTGLGTPALPAWMLESPEEGLDFVAKFPKGLPARMIYLEEILKKWATESPQEALQYSQSLDAGLALRAESGVLEGWLEVESAEAIDYISKHTTGHQKALLGAAVAQVYISEGRINTAIEWTQSNLSGVSKGQVMSQIMQSVPKEQLAQAAQSIAELDFGTAKRSATRTLAGRWAIENEGDALQWAQDQSDPIIRQEAMAAIAEAWMHSNVQKAANLVRDAEIGTDIARKVSSALREKDVAAWTLWKDSLSISLQSTLFEQKQ